MDHSQKAEPIYQTCFIQGQWRDVDRFEYDRAKGLREDLARIVYAAPQPSQPAQSAVAHPDWVNAEDMPTKPMGWYWAEFPGGWEFYKPGRNATLGIDHSKSGWNELRAKRYWGPFEPTAQSAVAQDDERKKDGNA